MPIYRVTDPTTNKTVKLTGDSPPTEQELEEVFKTTSSMGATPQPEKKEGIFDKFSKGFSKAADVVGLGSTVGNINAITNTPMLGIFSRRAENDIDAKAQQARALVAQARSEQDPTRKRALLDQSKQIMERVGTIGQNVSNLASSVQETGNIADQDLQRGNVEFAARRGIGQSAELGSFAVPFAKGAQAAKGAGAVARIGSAVSMGAQQGALQGVSQAAKNAESVGEAGRDIATGTLSGAATGGVMQGVMQGVGTATNKLKSSAGGIYAGTLKENSAAKSAIARQGGVEAMAKKANALKLPTTKEGVERELEKYAPKFEIKVEAALNKSKKANIKIKTKPLIDKTRRAVKEEFDNPQFREQYNQAMAYLDDVEKTYGDEMTAVSANRIRKSIDRSTGGKFAGEILQGKQRAMKEFGSELRSSVKEVVPETKQYFERYSLLADLSEAMQKEPKFGIVEAALSSPVAIGATATGNLPVAIGATGASLAGAKIIRSPGARRLLSRFAQNVKSPSASQINTNKTQIINPIISSFANNSSDQ